jgi:FkbM family methyltransferase
MATNISIQVRSSLRFRVKSIIKKTVAFFFCLFGFKISFSSTSELIISKYLDETLAKIRIADTLNSIEKIDNSSFKKFIMKNSKYLGEEITVLWVLFLLDSRKDGYFVEFGACDGLLFSNTNLFEKKFGWKGILAEPNRFYQKQLMENRSARIDTRAVWSRTGQLVEFAEVSSGGLSGIYTSFRLHKNGANKRERLGLKKYMVETVSLNDLLAERGAPNNFDLLAVDTEGSEFEILKNFDLKKYHPKIIVIEFDGSRRLEKKFKNLFIKFGYRSVGLQLKDQRNLWFVSNSISNLDKKL